MMVDVAAIRSDLKQSSDASSPQCDCGEEVATVHCNNCDVNLCDDCNESGHKRGVRKDHTRIPITQHLTAKTQLQTTLPSMMCPLHPTYPLIYFCEGGDCGVNICALCASKEHKTHTFVDIADAHSACTEDLMRAVEALIFPLSEVESAITVVGDQIKSVKSNADVAHQTVETEFKSAQRVMIARMKELQAEVAAERVRKIKLLQGQLDRLKNVQDCLENGKDVTLRIKEGTTATELLQVHALLQTGLAAAVNHEVPTTPVCGSDVRMVGVDMLASLKDTLATMCSIMSSDA